VHSFTDAAGREFHIPTITVGAIRKVREAAGVLLSEMYEPQQQPTLYDRLCSDCVLLGQVVAALIGDQLDKLKIKPSDWLDSLDGAALGRVHEAFFGAMADFFDATTRSPLLAKLCRLQTEPVNDRTEEASAGGVASTSTPPSAESTPTPIPSTS